MTENDFSMSEMIEHWSGSGSTAIDIACSGIDGRRMCDYADYYLGNWFKYPIQAKEEKPVSNQIGCVYLLKCNHDYTRLVSLWDTCELLFIFLCHTDKETHDCWSNMIRTLVDMSTFRVNSDSHIKEADLNEKWSLHRRPAQPTKTNQD